MVAPTQPRREAIDAIDAIEAGIARVLGLPGPLRGDTPLAAMGVDSLARILLADHCREAGWAVDEAGLEAARTVAEAADCLSGDARNIDRDDVG